MAIKITNSNVTSQDLNISANNTASKSVVKENSVMATGKVDAQYAELCIKLGITEEQLRQLCKLNSAFTTLPFEQQKQIVESKFQAVTSSNENEVQNVNDNNTETSSVSQKTNTEAVSQNKISQQNTSFNHKEYSTLSNKEKADVYALELAKNKFLYAQKDSVKKLDDWNALSNEERQKLVDTEFNSFVKSNTNNLFDDKDISFYFEKEMTKLQAANNLKKSISQFNNEPEGFQIDSVHDYVFGLTEENRTNKQTKYLENQYVLSKAVVQASKNNGDTSYQNGVDYNLSNSEISEKLKTLKGKTTIEVQMEYLQNKLDKGLQLDDKEKAVYERLNKFVVSEAGQNYLKTVKERTDNPSLRKDYGRLNALKSSEYGKMLDDAVSKDDKAIIINAYIKKAYANLSTEEKARAIAELQDELANNSDNAELVAELHQDTCEQADIALKTAIASQRNGIIPELNAVNIRSLGDDAKTLNALSAVQKELEIKEPKRVESLQLTTASLSTEKQAAILSDTYSSAKSEKVQLAIGQRAYSAKDVNNQKRIINNAAQKSTEKVRADLVKDSYKLDDSFEVEGMNNLIGTSKVVAKAANEAEVITKFAKENQTAAFDSLKNHIENLFDKKEAIEQLNRLTDQIPKCHKDNQLDMHNDIMKSKYSEVQEHAASNINKLDPGVQAEALDSVYKSGNEKAISAAVDSIKTSPEVVRSTEMKEIVHSIIMDEALKNNENNIFSDEFSAASTIDNASLKERIAGGYQLSRDEYESLSPQQKREYFTNYFNKLPLDKKIKLLSQMPDGAQKKTIYTLIARTDSNLFNAIIKDKDRADMLLGMGLPDDVKAKINGVVGFLAVADVGFQNIANKYEIEYDNAKRKDKASYTTNPYGFDTKDIYKKDKQGHLLG